MLIVYIAGVDAVAKRPKESVERAPGNVLQRKSDQRVKGI